jgi:hypothetical protein
LHAVGVCACAGADRVTNRIASDASTAVAARKGNRDIVGVGVKAEGLANEAQYFMPITAILNPAVLVKVRHLHPVDF